MNISSHILHQYISLPTDMREFRLLLDDLGLEVKKQEQKRPHQMRLPTPFSI